MGRKRKSGRSPDQDTTQAVIEVLRSLNLVDENGQPARTSVVKHEPHVAQGFSVKRNRDSGMSFDSVLSQESLRPLTSPGGVNTTAIAQLAFGPVDQEKTRLAASDGSGYGAGTSVFGRGTPDFTGIFNDPMMSTFSDPFINNNQSTLGFSMSRANPYMVNRQYGSGMYGDIPVYFMMMQEQNGGLLYWPINNREKLNWMRYFVRCFFANTCKTNITMSDGTIKDIREIKQGEEIITGLGTVRKVKQTFKKMCKENKAVKIKAKSLQNPLLVNHHHPFWVLRKQNFDLYAENNEFQPEWVNAENLQIGDWVLSAPLKPKKESEITVSQARLLGFYAAEGFIVEETRCAGTDEEGRKGWKWHQEKVSTPRVVKFTININEVNTLGKAIIDAIRVAFGVEAHIQPKIDTAVNVCISNRKIAEFCVKHVGRFSREKQLSAELMNASAEVKKHFLAAYADGDGTYRVEEADCGRIDIGTTSRHLAHQVPLMAISAGVMCRVFEGGRKRKHGGFKRKIPGTKPKINAKLNGPVYCITIPSWCANEIISRSCKASHVAPKRKKIGATMIGGYAAFKITHIEYSEQDDYVYNLEIDAEGDEKSFIANGMITHNTDPFVGAAIDLHTDMPLSRIGFSLPKLKNDPGRKKALACYKKVRAWADKVNLFSFIQSGFHEFWVVGNCYPFAEWSQEQKWWKRITILPPEEVSSVHFPFSEFAFAIYRPDPIVRLVFNVDASGEHNIPPIDRAIYQQLPADVIESIRRFGAILMDTDPFTGGPGEPCGSFMEHIARRRSSYQEQGVSVLERVIVPLLQKEHFKYTQLSLASRLMTPRNKVTAPGISPEATDFLRTEIDMSMEDPDYHIVTNFDFSWDTIGAQDRLIQLQPEYERIEGEILAALGVTKELVTGEASYGGTRITLDILNTRYLLIREVFQNYIEKKLLLGMAIANDWYEIDEETGEKEYYYPKLTFNRLSLRDNAEVFDALFQLYQKGSLPVKVIYEMFNLDPEEMNDLLTDDLFTPRDSTFNELLREVHTGVAAKLVDETDVKDKIIKTLGLKRVDEDGKPKIGDLQDVGTGVFAPPEPEAESAGLSQAPEETEEGAPPEVPGLPPGIPALPGPGGEPAPEEGAPGAGVPEEGLAPEEEIAVPEEAAPAPETP